MHKATDLIRENPQWVQFIFELYNRRFEELLSHFRNGNVDVRTAIIFGVPSIISVYAVRKFVVPIIPDPVFALGEAPVSKSVFILTVFSILMIIAALSMIRKSKTDVMDCTKKVNYNFPLILGEGVLVGAITGLVGASGGFLIIPALVLFGGLCMKKAVGTSLLIIALKSLFGFTGDLGSGLPLDIPFMLMFAGFATVGIIAGTLISKHISNQQLKPVFGWFVLAMGIYIISKELIFSA